MTNLEPEKSIACFSVLPDRKQYREKRNRNFWGYAQKFRLCSPDRNRPEASGLYQKFSPATAK